MNCPGHSYYCECGDDDDRWPIEKDDLIWQLDDISRVATDLRAGLVDQSYAIERIRMRAESLSATLSWRAS